MAPACAAERLRPCCRLVTAENISTAVMRPMKIGARARGLVKEVVARHAKGQARVAVPLDERVCALVLLNDGMNIFSQFFI